MNRHLYITTIVLLAALVSSCNKGEIDFTYSPENPRCGQTVSFSNSSTKGDTDSKWEWVFGDGATSTLKNPSKRYRKAGIYMVTLTLDGKKHQRAAKEISVFDSIPTFAISSENIGTYKDVTLTPLTYNPYNLNLVYEWTIPEDAVVVDSISKGITIFFKEDGEKEIELKTVLGNDTTVTKKTFNVYSTPAPSLLLSTHDGHILRQKIYERALSNPDTITPKVIQLGKISRLLVDGDNLYIYNMSDAADGAIYVMNLETNTVEAVIKTAGSQADSLYATGTVNNGFIYFTRKGNKAIYRVPATTRGAQFTDGKEQLFASESELKDFRSGDCGGIDIYGQLIYIGAENGIYRFAETDINSGSTPQTELIDGGKIQNLRIDRMTGKIYSVEEDKLTVRNIDGSFPAEIDKHIKSAYSLNINNSLNYVIFNQKDLILALYLIQTRNNTYTSTQQILSKQDAIALAIDEKERE